MIEMRTIKGPLDDRQLGWIAELYGPTDPKYASLDFVRHQFVGNPFGWSAHTFAIDGAAAVGHTAAVPFHTQSGGRPLLAGKLEAAALAPDYRGRRLESGASLIVELLETAYAFAHDCGIDILFGFAPPRVAAIHARAGCRRVRVEAPTYVLLTHPGRAARHWSRRRRLMAAVLALGQNALLAVVDLAARALTSSWGSVHLAQPTAADAELAATSPGNEAWTISGADAWEWFAGSGCLQAVEVPGRSGARAVVGVRAGDGSALQLVAWQPARPGLLPAVLLFGALRRIARRGGASTLRFQPWRGDHPDGALARAAGRLGFVTRLDTEMVLHTRDPAFDGLTVEVNPFFYVTF